MPESVIDLFVFFFLAPKGKTPSGGDVWVLLITDTKPSDSDLYVCEVRDEIIDRILCGISLNFNEFKQSYQFRR